MAFIDSSVCLRAASMLGVVTALQLVDAPAHAQVAASTEENESVFVYAFRGLGIGAPVGLSAGYLLTHDDSWGSEDWQHLAIGTAVGAIAGAAGGLAIGLADVSDGRSGMGAIVLRDTWYGTLLGITIGAIVGGVRWMGDGDGEDMLVSMAWGAVIGAPVGIGVGFAEAALRGEMGSTETRTTHVGSTPESFAPSLRFGLVPVITRGSEGSVGWMPSVSGTF